MKQLVHAESMIAKCSLIAGIFFLLIPALLAGGTEPTARGRSPKAVLDEGWDGKRIELKVGDEIRIELTGIGATGYAWYFDTLDQDHFQLVREGTRRDGNAHGDTVGTPVQYVWVLKAVKPGSRVIRMSCYRIWEGRDQAIRHFEVTVEVMP